MVHGLETIKHMNDQVPSQENASLGTFVHRIREMNKIFQLEANDVPTNLGVDRLRKFHKVIQDEVSELECITIRNPEADKQDENSGQPDLVELADVLGDIVVYAFSEARRWGIPLLNVLHIIMDSQDSKLVDGKPLMAEDGSKFIKGPNYVPPEENIRALLESFK